MMLHKINRTLHMHIHTCALDIAGWYRTSLGTIDELWYYFKSLSFSFTFEIMNEQI